MNEKLRVAAAQYELKPVESFEQFLGQITDQVRLAADYGSKLVLLPEYLSMQLLSLCRNDEPAKAVRQISTWYDQYRDFLVELARANACYVLGGTFPCVRDGALYNRALLASPHGKLGAQDKLRMTRFESEDWSVSSGEVLRIFDTSVGRLAVNICYDSEFPELARAAALAGATVLLVPTCTDNQYAYQRVRYCCRARAVENQFYVVQSVTVGSMPRHAAAALNHGRAAIFSPSDFGFPPEGILQEGPLNLPALVFGDLDFELLDHNRTDGSVRPLLDYRRSLTKTTGMETEICELR